MARSVLSAFVRLPKLQQKMRSGSPTSRSRRLPSSDRQDKNTGTTILSVSGGYWNLAWDLEGEEVAAWLNTIGVTGIVLKYRVPRRPDQPERLPAPGPLLDAQRAIRLTRSHAAEWGIDPGRVGIIGFSAGGHLAIATATHFDERSYEPIDEIDKASCRPDFAGAVYPGYLIEQKPRVWR